MKRRQIVTFFLLPYHVYKSPVCTAAKAIKCSLEYPLLACQRCQTKSTVSSTLNSTLHEENGNDNVHLSIFPHQTYHRKFSLNECEWQDSRPRIVVVV